MRARRPPPGPGALAGPLLAAVLAAAAGAWGQTTTSATAPSGSVAKAPPTAGPTWLTLAPPDSVTLTAGHGANVRLVATVKPGFHVQAHATRPGFIPTTVTALAVGPVSFGTPVYPKGRPFRLEGDTEYVNVYEGAFTVGLPVRASSSTRPGTYRFAGTLEYQACDASTCFPPRREPFAFTVFVTK